MDNKNCECMNEKHNHEKRLEEESFALTMVNALIATNKRLIAVIITLIVLFTGYIIYDAYTDSQYDLVGYDISADDSGNANFIGNNGDIYNNGKN